MPYTFKEYFETVKSYSEWHRIYLEAIPNEKLLHFERIIEKVMTYNPCNQPHFFSDDWRHYRNFYGFLLDSCLDDIKYIPRVAIMDRDSLNCSNWLGKDFILDRSFANPSPVHVMSLFEHEHLTYHCCPIKRFNQLPVFEPEEYQTLGYFTKFDEAGNRLAFENNWPESLIFVKDYRRSKLEDSGTILLFYTNFFHEDNCMSKSACKHNPEEAEPIAVLSDILDFKFECSDD